jgi:hypothetical protein
MIMTSILRATPPLGKYATDEARKIIAAQGKAYRALKLETCFDSTAVRYYNPAQLGKDEKLGAYFEDASVQISGKPLKNPVKMGDNGLYASGTTENTHCVTTGPGATRLDSGSPANIFSKCH